MGILQNAVAISWARFPVLQLSFSFIFFCSLVHARAVPTCDGRTYGKPRGSDCTALFQKFTEGQDLRSRLFVEEQLRAESDYSWPGVANPLIPPIVQIPKYYSMNTCNFAIMPYTNPNTHTMLPLGITSWGSIKISGSQLMAECLKKGSNSGGEIFVRDNTAEDPVLVIWMWASGANFEASLNKYENEPTFSPQLSMLAVNPTENNQTNGTLISAEKNSSAPADTHAGPPLPSTVSMSNTGSIDVS